MATCKRCKGVKRIHEFVVSRGEVEKVTTACPDCKGTGETWTDAEIEEEYARECARIAEEEQCIRESGICPDCGAKNDEEAQRMCIPREIADTGDYSCAATVIGMLWTVDEGTGEVEDSDEGDNTNKGDGDA